MNNWLQRLLGSTGAPIKPRKAPGRPPVRPTPLVRDRIGAYLSAHGYSFIVDEDGDLTGTWDGDRFWFLTLGEHAEILQVRGRWHRALPLAQRKAVALSVNDWNRERIWPKAYVREEEGMLALYSEVSTDLEEGVTDDQLAQLVACGLGTGVQLFAALNTLIPPDADPPAPHPGE